MFVDTTTLHGEFQLDDSTGRVRDVRALFLPAGRAMAGCVHPAMDDVFDAGGAVSTCQGRSASEGPAQRVDTMTTVAVPAPFASIQDNLHLIERELSGSRARSRAAARYTARMADTRTVRDVAERTHMALLVDGDNAQPSLVEPILAEAVKYGTMAVRRIYGDWTTPNMSGWKAALQGHAFQPQQQFRYTTGKNATDSALIIDAMDLLHSGRIDGFCIVSSDSDFTRLATRIREHGLFVMGIGEPKTPKAFVNACDVFVLTTNLAAELKPEISPKEEDDWTKVMRRAVSAAAGEDGWAFLGAVGVLVRKLDPAFDPRSFGHRQLSALVKSKPKAFRTRVSKNEHGAAVIDVKPVD